MDSALSLYAKSTRIDEQFLPAHLSFMILMRKQGRSIDLRTHYELAGPPDPFALCLNVIAWGMSGHDVPEASLRYRELLRKQGRTSCTEVARVSLTSGLDIRPELLREALRRFGNAPFLMRELADAQRTSGDKASPTEMFRAEIANAPASSLALAYELELVQALLNAGRREAAVAEDLVISRAFRSDSRPFVRWKLLELDRNLLVREKSDFAQRWRDMSIEMRTIARRSHATAFEVDALRLIASEDIDRGDLRSAVNSLNEAVTLAVESKSPDLRLVAFVYRGRALAAQGKQEAAIADLQRAANAARLLGDRYRLAEAYHHMAHAYEARANWPKAIAAADSFVSIGASVRDKSMRMIRLSDAAAIQWKAGYHARANQRYLEMVRTIDADSANYEYAGAFFERTGDLARAADYYRKTWESPDKGSAKLALAGLTRVYEQLGFLDSAVATARKHDALVHTPEREILLPRLLARQGRTAEAIGQAERWVKVQILRGNPVGTASAINQHAELVLATNPRATLALLVKSESIAKVVTSIPEIVAARRLRGLAKAQLGDVENGTSDVISALSLATRMQDVFLPVTLTTDIAAMSARARRPRTALIWYARANDALRTATTNFDDPVLIARFRNARKEIFDGALRSVFQLPESERTAKFLEWSERKKGPSAVQTRERLVFPNLIELCWII